jgi:hypothetical protein
LPADLAVVHLNAKDVSEKENSLVLGEDPFWFGDIGVKTSNLDELAWRDVRISKRL